VDDSTLRRPPLDVLRKTLEASRSRRWTVPHPSELTATLGEAPDASLCPKTLRVLVWNVYKGRRRGFAPQFRALASDRDLILAQELFFEEDTHALLGELEVEWTTATSFTYARRDHVGTGLGTAARASSLRAWALQTTGREPLTRTPKLALLTEYQLGAGFEAGAVAGGASPGLSTGLSTGLGAGLGPALGAGVDVERKLLVANVHAINFAGFGNFEAQLQHIELALAAHRGPALLAGDFNTWTTRRLRRLDGLMRNTGLEPVAFAKDRRATPLDHAFVRELDVLDSRIHRSRASDHAALSFELALAKSSAPLLVTP
jgi:endonuclease/exonuclease/phosphatase (EEP) superfamily protein YafD